MPKRKTENKKTNVKITEVRDLVRENELLNTKVRELELNIQGAFATKRAAEDKLTKQAALTMDHVTAMEQALKVFYTHFNLLQDKLGKELYKRD